MRPASKDEIQLLCRAIAREEENAHLDQAIDLDACLRSAMTVRAAGSAPEISGRVIVRFPGYTLTETCRAVLQAARVDPKTIHCR